MPELTNLIPPMDPKKYYTYAKLRWTNPNTLKCYSTTARKLEAYWINGIITQETINLYLSSISRNKSYGNPFYYSFLRGYLECYREDLRIRRIRLQIIKPTSRRLTNKNYKFLTLEDVRYILEHLQNPHLSLIVRLFFETGLRVSELLKVRLKDIDFGARTIKGIGKGNKAYEVKFSPKTREILQRWVDSCPRRDQPFMFFNRTHEYPVKNQAFACWYHLNRAGEKIGFEGIHPHRFRHALGYFLRKDIRLDLSEIKEKLRHSDISSTQIYAPATKEEVDRKIDKLVFKVKDGI